MRPEPDEIAPIVLVAPTRTRARTAAAALRRAGVARRFSPWSLDALLRSRAIPEELVLCPAGATVAGDLAFLEEAGARLLWPAPPPPLFNAVAGLIGGVAERPFTRRSPAPTPPALLLEGRVTPARARRALASDARTWIVRRAADVRLSPAELSALADRGVRWTVLSPVRVHAVAASPALARSRAWRRLLPARTPVWVVRTNEP